MTNASLPIKHASVPSAILVQLTPHSATFYFLSLTLVTYLLPLVSGINSRLLSLKHAPISPIATHPVL